jgi:iron only hydrogenase large subunit-like protein
MRIDIDSTMPYTTAETASRDAHNFAKTTGVFTAVKNHIGEEDLEGVVIADLNKKNIAMLKGYAKTGKCPGKLIEVMSCPGGCITGPCACSQGGEASRRFEAEVKKK